MGRIGILYQKLFDFAYRLESYPVFASLKRAFLLLVPVVLTGSVAVLIQNFPHALFQELLGGGAFFKLLQFIQDSTLGFMSVYLLFGISYYYVAELLPEKPLLHILSVFTSFACFIASFGGINEHLELSCFGTVGVFTAMICAVLATRIFAALNCFLTDKIHYYSAGADDQYRSSMNAVVPFFACVLLFSLANLLLVKTAGVNNFNELISIGFEKLFAGIHQELAGGVLFTGFLNLLWIFGIHGGNALDEVAKNVFAAGQTQIITKSFFDIFVVMGGSGTSICLLLALLFVSRSKNNRMLAYCSAPMAVFNINEMLVYGLPVVLNPVIAVPFVLVPVGAMLISYFAAKIGFLPPVAQELTWTSPILFSGYLATGSLRGTIVQLLTICGGTAIYIPFIRFSEKLQQKHTADVLQELVQKFQREAAEGQSSSYLNRKDKIGILAKDMIKQLQNDMQKREIPLFYQPEMDDEYTVSGAEALLRWRYQGNLVYPPLVIALAKEDGCFDRLTLHILSQVCGALGQLQEESPELKVSVNIQPQQLDDRNFVQQMVTLVECFRCAGHIILEVTEETSLVLFSHIAEHINLLHKRGILTAIDDFSMGQTSLNYLKDSRFQFVKLDGSLVRQIPQNERCREIIRSIITLGEQLGFEVVAEYVEDEPIYRILQDLGCKHFQGYYFSKALPIEEFKSYCLEKRR